MSKNVDVEKIKEAVRDQSDTFLAVFALVCAVVAVAQ